MDSDNKALDTLPTESANVSLPTNEFDSKVIEQPAINPVDTLIRDMTNISLSEAVSLEKAQPETEANNSMEIVSEEPILHTPEDKHAEAKAAYLNKILNPTDEYEKNHLEQKLTPTFTDKKNGITKQQKLDKLVEELGHNFDELTELQAQTNFILNEYADANFKPQEAGKSFLGGFMETEEARAARKIKENEERRKQFIEQNREKCLLEALREEIRHSSTGISPEKIQKLDKEERVQKLLETPKYQNRVGKQLDSAVKIKPQDFKKNSDLLNVAIQAKSNAKLDPKELFTKTAMGQKSGSRTVMFNQFKSSLASAKNQVVDEIEVKAGRKKGFKSLV